ncbi:MAG: ABC transporter ATP-binding protein [Eubacterium sp.]|nr:ABC transporter ATP-binding protein [Eubacterium sp.]
MLSIKDLNVAYGMIRALDDVNLEVEEGQLTTLIGSNGAGKSTLLKTISGLLKPLSGEITFMGTSIGGWEPEKVIKLGISHCPEGRKLFPNQTVMENLRIGAYVRNDKKGIDDDIEKYLDMFPRLRERSNQKAGLLSGGEQQMVAIVRAMMSRPKLVMLDEPSMGLAPLLVQDVFNLIKEIKKSGVTILLIEQNARQALQVADYAYILESGHIVAQDKASVMLDSPELVERYLGG